MKPMMSKPGLLFLCINIYDNPSNTMYCVKVKLKLQNLSKISEKCNHSQNIDGEKLPNFI